MKSLFALLSFLSLLLQACSSHIASTREFIPYDKKKVLEASKQVADKLSMEKKEGPMDAFITVSGSLVHESVTVPDADLFIRNSGRFIINNTEILGALKFTDNLSATECLSVIGSPRGDPVAYSHLFPALIQQQIEFNQNARQPYVNPTKSIITFVPLNLISPILGVMYLEKGNPLISESMLKNIYLQYGCADAIMVGCVLGSLLIDNHKAKIGLASFGISIGVLMRLFTLTNIVDLQDYNHLAGTNYNIGIIRKQ